MIKINALGSMQVRYLLLYDLNSSSYIFFFKSVRSQSIELDYLNENTLNKFPWASLDTSLLFFLPFL